ncbi:MAG: L-arabinose isomerase family protein [Pirellulaceae bacterium]
MNAGVRPTVGLLALTLELYETLAPGLRGSREAWLRQALIPALQPHAEVLFETAVFRREDIESAVSRCEINGADVILVVLLTYAPSQLALPALQRTRLPVVIWNTQQLQAVDQSFSVADMIDNHGVHGTQDLASVLTRSGLRFHYVTSPADDPQGLAELGDYFAAAAAVRRLHSTRIGMLGYPFPGMGDFAVDTTHLTATLGCSWTHLTVEDYIQRSATARTADVTPLVTEYRNVYDVAADVTDADLEVTARAELAVRGMVRDHRLDALTYQFMAFGDDERTSSLPFVAASRLMAEGIGFGGEGDLIAAAATTFLHSLQPPASFSEIFTIDFVGESLFMSHMGEANVGMARRDRKVPLVARPTPITRTRDRQLVLVTSLEPSPATFAALTLGPGGIWRWIAAPVTIQDYGPLPGFCVPHFKIRPQGGGVREFLTRYAQAGGPHHNAICFGDARRRLRMAAELSGADYCEI